MIALFARSNHPHGYGYSAPDPSRWPTHGIGAHGYVVVGFRCRSSREADCVVRHVRRHGIDLPDSLTGRKWWTGPKDPEPDVRANGESYWYHTDIGRENVLRWYSGGPGDWDYLFTVRGNTVDWEWLQQATQGSRGDNRFCMVYEADQLLRKD